MEMTAFQRRAAVAVVSVAAVTAMSAAVAPAARAGSYWGSIAASGHTDSQGRAQYGRAMNYPTKAAAESAAISACGLSDCTTMVDFQDCGAVARSGNRLSSGGGSSLAAAEQAALNEAGGGAIDVWACNK